MSNQLVHMTEVHAFPLLFLLITAQKVDTSTVEVNSPTDFNSGEQDSHQMMTSVWMSENNEEAHQETKVYTYIYASAVYSHTQ